MMMTAVVVLVWCCTATEPSPWREQPLQTNVPRAHSVVPRVYRPTTGTKDSEATSGSSAQGAEGRQIPISQASVTLMVAYMSSVVSPARANRSPFR